jgi:hypothetical protein
LEELPEDLRVPLILHYLQGRDQAAVAEKLGVSKWRRFEAGDFILWSWANAERKAAAAATPPWDKAKWKWKFEEDRVLRQS